MVRVGSGYMGSPELMNSGDGNLEIVPQSTNDGGNKYSFYKFEFVSPEIREVTVRINNGEPICLCSGYFTTEPSDAEINSFIIETPNVDFYWYGAY